VIIPQLRNANSKQNKPAGKVVAQKTAPTIVGAAGHPEATVLLLARSALLNAEGACRVMRPQEVEPH